MTLLLVALAAASVVGYSAGRARPGQWLLDWARDETAIRHSSSPVFWAAALVVLVALTSRWIIHPRDSAANVRSWRANTPGPAPRYDPDWAAPPPTTEGPPQ
ncbi:hypothetical protein ACGFR8_07720 [Streptomyces brevispora]|uniref:hypothetical protein n=1 Tax=Streptomyces brevispora TaxID=887462 RepID=UPI003715E448